MAGERDVVRECTKYHMMEAEVRSHPFKPSINSYSHDPSKGEHKPIHKRTDEILKRKQEHLNILREQAEVAVKVVGEEAVGGKGTGQRLHSEAARMVEKSIDRQNKFQQVEKTSNTFTPR